MAPWFWSLLRSGFIFSLNLFFSSSSKFVDPAFYIRLLSVFLSLFFFLSLCVSLSLSVFLSVSFFFSLTHSLSLCDHTQRFLFPVGVMSLLHKQSALICQRSSRRFIKIQQASTKDVYVPALAPYLRCPRTLSCSFRLPLLWLETQKT